ncbi:hypothetical protein Tsubulata_035299 [Turnera subulata]|uniref:Origin recognition complex subunit 3 winged helix C-terminal domain-containing protein n=1 Tax=Turnera subulata TaxID=218843 RepID=A0A9Q0JJH7_9ROSI|nr:hypothetical protein Tsubulata_035299 [Turnera subulata]
MKGLNLRLSLRKLEKETRKDRTIPGRRFPPKSGTGKGIPLIFFYGFLKNLQNPRVVRSKQPHPLFLSLTLPNIHGVICHRSGIAASCRPRSRRKQSPASTSKKSAKKHTGTPKTRRRIELSENGEDLGAEKDGEIDDRDNVNMRMEAFETVWSGIESTFKGVLRDMNTNVFNEIHQWVRDSFNAIVSLGVPSFAEATRSFPILTDATSKRLFTGLTADMSILATWYREQGSTDKPVIVIIDDMERCCGEWVLKIPIILIMGVTTTLDAVKNILPSNALHYMCPCKFILGTAFEKMDAVVDAILVKQSHWFRISHKVATFLRTYFVRKDGTVTSFIRALKIACAQHFFLEPLSFMLEWFLLGDGSQVKGMDYHQKHCSSMLLSFHLMVLMGEQNVETLVNGLEEMKKLLLHWSIVVQCLHESGKYGKVRLLDIFCEALDPLLCSPSGSKTDNNMGKDSTVSPGHQMSQQHPGLRKGGFIDQAVRTVSRDLPGMQLLKLLQSWEKHTMEAPQIHYKVKELLSELKSEDNKRPKNDMNVSLRRHVSRGHVNTEKDSTSTNEKAARLILWMVREYMLPIECIAFHEIVCFKNADQLQAALIGDPRRRIQVDLLESQTIISCKCCSRTGNILLSSMHDTSVMYTLAQQHGDLINLHDWYQSFKSVVLCRTNKKKQRSKHSPSPKKRKAMTEPAKPSEASIQARFCRAVTELQVAGLLRMPSKRRPDFVQRVAFGL